MRPLSEFEMDPSIINLRRDPHKFIFLNKNRSKDDIIVSLDQEEDKVLRMDLIRFFEEDGGQGWFNAKKLREEKKLNDKEKD